MLLKQGNWVAMSRIEMRKQAEPREIGDGNDRPLLGQEKAEGCLQQSIAKLGLLVPLVNSQAQKPALVCMFAISANRGRKKPNDFGATLSDEYARGVIVGRLPEQKQLSPADWIVREARIPQSSHPIRIPWLKWPDCDVASSLDTP
jgi:hypothetical protein